MTQDEFNGRTLTTIKEVCIEKETFTADDVFEKLGDIPAHINRRVMGGLFNRARKEGWCDQTASRRTSRRRESHSSRISVWYSKLWKGVGDG
jgi:hypothetical protein